MKMKIKVYKYTIKFEFEYDIDQLLNFNKDDWMKLVSLIQQIMLQLHFNWEYYRLIVFHSNKKLYILILKSYGYKTNPQPISVQDVSMNNVLWLKIYNFTSYQDMLSNGEINDIVNFWKFIIQQLKQRKVFVMIGTNGTKKLNVRFEKYPILAEYSDLVAVK